MSTQLSDNIMDMMSQTVGFEGQKSMPNSHNIIQILKKVQFISEFFILSKFSEGSDYLSEFFILIEALRFYFKSVAASESPGLYLSTYQKCEVQHSPLDSLSQPTASVQQEIERQEKIIMMLKEKPYQKLDYHPLMMEKLSNGKKVQLVTAVGLPDQLKKSSLSTWHCLGEVLHLLRPLFSIICIRLLGVKSYKSYAISLGIDLWIILVFQKGLKITGRQEKDEISERRKETIMRCIFRKPVFGILLKFVFMPLLAKIIKPERMLSKLLISLLEMQSSISLNL